MEKLFLSLSPLPFGKPTLYFYPEASLLSSDLADLSKKTLKIEGGGNMCVLGMDFRWFFGSGSSPKTKLDTEYYNY